MLEVEPIKLVNDGESSEVFARRLHHRYATAKLPSATVISFSRVIAWTMRSAYTYSVCRLISLRLRIMNIIFTIYEST